MHVYLKMKSTSYSSALATSMSVRNNLKEENLLWLLILEGSVHGPSTPLI